MLEIEKKARIDDPAQVERKLSTMGRLEGETVKEDRYYLIGWQPGTVPDMARDPIFRLRLTGGRAVVGWKRRTFAGSAEVNEEHEIDMGEAGPALDWIEGYLRIEPFVVKHKRTRSWRLGGQMQGVCVEVNHVLGLGHFVEIEIMSEPAGKSEALAALDRVLSMLSIPESAVEPRYYIDLLMEI